MTSSIFFVKRDDGKALASGVVKPADPRHAGALAMLGEIERKFLPGKG